jgi:hypothetical protein
MAAPCHHPITCLQFFWGKETTYTNTPTARNNGAAAAAADFDAAAAAAAAVAAAAALLLSAQAPEVSNQTWVETVAAASDMRDVRRCLAQFEAALASWSSSNIRERRGTRPEALELLAPAWRHFSRCPLVKGAWLTCPGGEVAAAALNGKGQLVPWQPPTSAAAAAAAAAADVTLSGVKQEDAAAAGTAAAAASALQDDTKQDVSQQQRQQQQWDLCWLPPTAAALSLRLCALDALLQYPVLGKDRDQLVGRELLGGYR